MKDNNKISLMFGINLIVVILLLLYVIINNSNVFPLFTDIFANMFLLLFTSDLIVDISFSFLRVFISFILGSIIGIGLGIFAGINKKNEYRLLPIISFLKAIPTLAFILIFIIYVKFSYIYIITLLIIPIVYQATTSAISFNNNRYKNTFLIRNGKTDLHSIFKVLLPSSQVEITNSFIQSFSLGLKAQVLVESFSSKSNFRGLGKLIYLSFQNSETLDMYSMILIIVIFSLLIDLLLTFIRSTIEKRNTNQILI